MPEAYRADALATTRHVVVLLRLAVGAGGRILYGEVVDPDTQKGHPFHRLAGLPTALREWLAAVIPLEETAHEEEPDRGDLPRTRCADLVANAEVEDPCLPS